MRKNLFNVTHGINHTEIHDENNNDEDLEHNKKQINELEEVINEVNCSINNLMLKN